MYTSTHLWLPTQCVSHILVIICGVVIVTGVIGNVIILLVVGFVPGMKTSVNLCLASLACIDTLILSFLPILPVISTLNTDFIVVGREMCKYMVISLKTSSVNSAQCLLLYFSFYFKARSTNYAFSTQTHNLPSIEVKGLSTNRFHLLCFVQNSLFLLKQYCQLSLKVPLNMNVPIGWRLVSECLFQRKYSVINNQCRVLFTTSNEAIVFMDLIAYLYSTFLQEKSVFYGRSNPWTALNTNSQITRKVWGGVCKDVTSHCRVLLCQPWHTGFYGNDW